MTDLTALDADGATTTDGAVDFAGDVDWFNFSVPDRFEVRPHGRRQRRWRQHRLGAAYAGLRAAGRRDQGSQPRLAPQLAVQLPRNGGHRVLEVTGSGIGGYTITGTCSPLVTSAPPAATRPDDDGRSRTQYHYDDYRPSYRLQGVSNPTRPEPVAYGEIDISSSQSRTGDGELEHYRDTGLISKSRPTEKAV